MTHLKADVEGCAGIDVLVVAVLFAGVDVHFVVHGDGGQ
jgi:hypothetical protein